MSDYRDGETPPETKLPGETSCFTPEGDYLGSLDEMRARARQRIERYCAQRGVTVGFFHRERNLRHAVRSGDARHVEDVLAEGGDANQRWPDGITLLMLAAARGCDQIVELLLRYGANACAEDFSGGAAADYAERNGHSALAVRLRDLSH
jgi:hypothetical protein